MKKKYIFLKNTGYFSAALFIFAAAQPTVNAYAENIDYGTLESVFNEPVTTSVTGTPQRASDLTTNMVIITADEIRQSGSRSIPEILSRVPGIDVLQTGYAGFDVGVRGTQEPTMPRLMVLVDGRQVFIDDYSRTNWNNIPVNIDDIRQIEVVKGSASALFGSNAAGGVVNIITYSPLYDKNNVVSAYAGSERTFGADATITQNASWGGTKTTVGGYNAHEFNSTSNSLHDSFDTDPYHRYLTNSSVFQVTPDFQINTELTYSYSKSDYALATYTTAGDEDTTYSVRGGFQWQTDYGLIINDNYFNHTYDNLLTLPGDFGMLPFTTGLAVSKLEDRFRIGTDNIFRLALEYRNKSFVNGNGYDFVPENPELVENNYAASATWLWQINDKLSWTNAVRFDHLDMGESGTLPQGNTFSYADYDHVINTISANSGINYKATDKDTFILSYGRGVLQPGMVQSGLNINGNNTFPSYIFLGSPDLKPTIVQNYEVDYDRQIESIHSTARFGIFYQFNQDLISYASYPSVIAFGGQFPVLLSTSQNAGNDQSWGGELELKGEADGFRWDASYSLARVDDGSNTLEEQLLNYQGSAPEHHVRLLGGYTWNSWEFDANGQYVTSSNQLRSVINFIPVPITESGYYSFGGRIGYNINDKLILSLSGQNLNHQYIQESPYPAVERTALVSLTKRF